MSVWISGMSCVTPLGATPEEVWRRLAAGEHASAEELVNPETGRKHRIAKVPPATTAHLNREPRLRRASAISPLAAAAGLAAMASAPALDGAQKARLAVVLGVSSGGVQYTRRFYEQVVNQGASAASPMLFPETVYNAPASHLAAMLGVDGATYTLVGDGTVGLQALHFATQLLDLGDADHVLVVAAEELDWILLEAHHQWRLTAHGGRSGATLAEGGAAILLSRAGSVRLHAPEGQTYFNRQEAAQALSSALQALPEAERAGLVVSGDNDTWIDHAEATALAALPGVSGRKIIVPKRQLGECLGAGALLQVVLAAEGLRQLDQSVGLVTSVGWSQQAAAALIERAASR